MHLYLHGRTHSTPVSFLIDGMALPNRTFRFTWIRTHSETSIRSRHFRLAQLIFTGGLILSIIGGVNARAAASPGTLSQVAIVLYFLGLAACVFLEISAWARTAACGSVPAGERSTIYAVAAALPLIFTRILFSALAVFLHDSKFSIVRGSTGVYVGMVVVQEVLVVVMYTIVGWQLDRLEYIWSQDQDGGPGVEG